MPKVFIINNTTHDYEKAAKYGILQNVTVGKVPLFKTDTIVALLKENLKDFSDKDYLLLSGPSWLSILATIIVATRVTTIKFILFDAKEQDYIIRHLDINALQI